MGVIVDRSIGKFPNPPPILSCIPLLKRLILPQVARLISNQLCRVYTDFRGTKASDMLRVLVCLVVLGLIISQRIWTNLLLIVWMGGLTIFLIKTIHGLLPSQYADFIWILLCCILKQYSLHE